MKSLRFFLSLSSSLTSFFIMAVYHSLIIICIVLDSHYTHKKCCFTDSICVYHLLLSTYSDCVLLCIAHYTIINRIPISFPHFSILVFVFHHLIFTRFFQRSFFIALIEILIITIIIVSIYVYVDIFYFFELEICVSSCYFSSSWHFPLHLFLCVSVTYIFFIFIFIAFYILRRKKSAMK